MTTATTALPAALLPLQKAIGLIVSDNNVRDLSARQIAILMRVAERPNPALGVRELAEEFNITKPAVTRATDTLVNGGGLIRRRQHPMDRRRVELTLTPAGQRYLDKLAKGVAA